MRLIARMLKCEYISVLNAPACGMQLNSSTNNLHLDRKLRLKIGFLLQHLFEFLSKNDILAVKLSKVSK